MQYGLGLFEAFRSVHCYGRFTLGIRLGLFPLWLRAPRFVCAALSSHSALLSGARGGSCLGRGRNPLPSSGFILVPSDSTPSTTPLLVFIREFVLSLPLRDLVTSMRVGARP